MDPYAKPNERKVGARRPKISHLPSVVDTRTRKERQAEKSSRGGAARDQKVSAPAFETQITIGSGSHRLMFAGGDPSDNRGRATAALPTLKPPLRFNAFFAFDVGR
jgi:hypothetical protein